MRCYIALGISSLLGVFKYKKIANTVFAGIALAFLVDYVDPEFLGFQKHVSSAIMCFFVGVLIFSNREKLILDVRIALAATVVLYLSFGESWFPFLYLLTWPYLLFYLAYRTGFLNIDGKIGDCSYGIYIYAYPVQQLTAYLMPTGTPYTNMIITTLVVVPLALLSWRYIEKPALALKSRYMTHSGSA